MMGFISKLKKSFVKENNTKQSSLHIDLENINDIPRYPPFVQGLPSAKSEQIILTQNTLIKKIQISLGMNDSQFDSFFLPVIKNYASYVHLLPASETHHHRGAGGLFRHGLEVSFYCSVLSEGVIFSKANSPQERRKEEPVWRLACAISGLLHDIGKTYSDIAVTNQDGSMEWNPYVSSLECWLLDQKIDRYFIRWKNRQHKEHERFSLFSVHNILNQQVLTKLTLGGANSEIMSNLLSTITGSFVDNKMTGIMLKADGESVRKDLINSRMNVDEYSYGVPIVRYIVDAIRRLVRMGKWKINEPGGHVWRLHEGTFIVWKNLRDVFSLIDKDSIPGIPRDLDTLADILIEQGFAQDNTLINKTGASVRYRYWLIQPETTNGINLMCLKFDSDEFVFGDEQPPVAINGKIVSNEQNETQESNKEQINNPNNKDDNGSNLVEKQSENQVEYIELDAVPENDDPLVKLIGLGGSLGYNIALDAKNNEVENKNNLDKTKEKKETSGKVSIMSSQYKIETEAELIVSSDHRENIIKNILNTKGTEDGEHTVEIEEIELINISKNEFLSKYNNIAMLAEQIIDLVNHENLKIGNVILDKKRICINYNYLNSQFGRDLANKIISGFLNKNLLVKDLLFAKSKTHLIAGKKCIVLNEQLSLDIMSLLKDDIKLERFNNNILQEKVINLEVNDDIAVNAEQQEMVDIEQATKQIVNPKETKLNSVLCSLKTMIKERKGEWLTSSVDLVEIDKKKFLATSLSCLDNISSVNPGINKHLLRGAIANDNFKPRLKLDKQKRILYLEIE